jgi:hypothetical protein
VPGNQEITKQVATKTTAFATSILKNKVKRGV